VKWFEIDQDSLQFTVHGDGIHGNGGSLDEVSIVLGRLCTEQYISKPNIEYG
jgi:hypothetical protein